MNDRDSEEVEVIGDSEDRFTIVSVSFFLRFGFDFWFVIRGVWKEALKA